jgi:hypothetical protein
MYTPYHCRMPEEPSDERERRRWYKEIKERRFEEDARAGVAPHVLAKAKIDFLGEFEAFLCKKGLKIKEANVVYRIVEEFHKPAIRNMKIVLDNALAFVVHNFKEIKEMNIHVIYREETHNFSFFVRLPLNESSNSFFKKHRARFVLFYNSQEHLFATIGDEMTSMDEEYIQMDKDNIVAYKCESMCGCGVPYPRFYCGGCTTTRFCSNQCEAFTTKATCPMIGCNKKFNCKICRHRHLRTCNKCHLVCTDPIYL